MEQLTRGAPEEFAKYINYCKGLMFEEKPDYNYMRQLFKSLMTRSEYTNDGRYDWILKKEGQENQVHMMISREEKKAPIPRQANEMPAAGRGRETQEREERKNNRANMGN